MVRLYIYKILFNKKGINFFYKEENIEKYKLKEYIDFTDILQIKNWENIFKLNHKVKTLNEEYYNELFQLIKIYEKENFKNEINTKEFNVKKYGIDNFFVLSYDIIISNLQMEGNSNINKDFYYNICYPLFKGENELSKVIELFYDPQKFNEIKTKYCINSNNIKQLLYGYRFCLNTLYSPTKDGIYYSLYNYENINNIKNKYYPGNDSKINKVYSKIINHFESKPDDGCYVCICNNLYYHSIPFGFPQNNELNKKCPMCCRSIGLLKEGSEFKIVNRKDYFRIFKDEEEIEKIKKDKIKMNKLKEINYMTLKKFKSTYIDNEMKKEKGICLSDENSFKNDTKIIRNLSQISYRLLNYILYTHLFFSRLILDKELFDEYLPKGMSWVETLNECWILLKNELSKKDIYSIESFMEYIFTDLFPILNQKKNINEYEDLINLEDNLEKKIQEMMIKFKRHHEFLESKEYKDNKDEKSLINLLTEKYRNVDDNFEEYPFYQYFYYTNYIDEEYLNETLNHKDKKSYPVLSQYLELRNNHKQDKYKYLSNNFILFNDALNLINQKYYNNISKQYAEKQKLKNVEIYWNNQELFDNFIKLYNNLEIEDMNKKKLKLSNDNPLCNFFIDENNNFGKTYKILYKAFIKQQNDKIENLLDLKIDRGIFNISCKNRIDVQCIKPNDIFNINNMKNFIHIIYNSSYRKILDCSTKNYQIYNEYIINLDLVEEFMTNSLLKNKKLLNETIHEFKYSHEDFINQISDSITKFKNKYSIVNINIDDKIEIYKFHKEIEGSVYLCKQMIRDFLQLIKLLEREKVDNSNRKIYEILFELKYEFSDIFQKFFEKQKKLIVNKIIDIFDYYLKLIYENIKSEIKDFQEELDQKSLDNIKNYFSTKHLISKKDLSRSIRLFISLVLFLEEDKENKIKFNYNNIISYLNSKDLWESDIYNNDKFLTNLNELKSLDIKICQIFSAYEVLGKDIEDSIFNDINQMLNNKEVLSEEEKQEYEGKINNEDDDDDSEKGEEED